MIPVVLGTRGSALALAQTRQVMADLRHAWPQRTFEICTIKTDGDRLSENPDVPAGELEKGLFTRELETALLDGRIHIAVHSLKDLPTEMAADFVLAAIPPRANARDVLITRGETSLEELPYQARIGTGSPRRAAQLSLARQDLLVEAIRGNIDTRLRKVRKDTSLAAIVLAAAGLERLKPDLAGLVATPLPLDLMLPAPGQGALALQTRTEAADVIALASALHDPVSAARVEAERMLLQALGGGCQEPVGAYATVQPENRLRLDAIAWLFDDPTARRGYLIRDLAEAQRLGIELAVELSR